MRKEYKNLTRLTIDTMIRELEIVFDFDKYGNNYVKKRFSEIKEKLIKNLENNLKDEEYSEYIKEVIQRKLVFEFLLYKLSLNNTDGVELEISLATIDVNITPIQNLKLRVEEWMNALIFDSMDDFGGTLDYLEGFIQNIHKKDNEKIIN